VRSPARSGRVPPASHTIALRCSTHAHADEARNRHDQSAPRHGTHLQLFSYLRCLCVVQLLDARLLLSRLQCAPTSRNAQKGEMLRTRCRARLSQDTAAQCKAHNARNRCVRCAVLRVNQQAMRRPKRTPA
jgi:hypothetical protein